MKQTHRMKISAEQADRDARAVRRCQIDPEGVVVNVVKAAPEFAMEGFTFQDWKEGIEIGKPYPTE